MSTETKKSWTRWVEKTKEFPKPKYYFTQHLRHIGDYVETHPISQAEYMKIKDAAKFWAWNHDCRVSIKKNRKANNMCTVRVTLISKHRIKEYYG